MFTRQLERSTKTVQQCSHDFVERYKEVQVLAFAPGGLGGVSLNID